MSAPLYSKLKLDGIFGSVSIRALQTYMSAKQNTYPYAQDGYFGYYTVLGMQKWMQKRGYYKGYWLDGTAGPKTWSEFYNMIRYHYGTTVMSPNQTVSVFNSRNQAYGVQAFLNDHRWR
jgi:hypothetical protein